MILLGGVTPIRSEAALGGVTTISREAALVLGGRTRKAALLLGGVTPTKLKLQRTLQETFEMTLMQMHARLRFTSMVTPRRQVPFLAVSARAGKFRITCTHGSNVV